MDKLTLENIAPFLPYGLKVISKEKKIFSVGIELNSVSTETIVSEVIDNEDLLILRPMDLTKPITVDGKEIMPIVELLKLLIKPKEYYTQKDINGKILSAVSNDGYKLMHISNTIFIFSNQSTNLGFDMLPVLKWLYAYKFDIEGLIKKGLAIDVNTLETNPYS